MKYESSILKRLIDTYGVVGNPRYLSEIIKEFIVRGKELYPQLFTYQSDWLAHIDEFGLTPEYTVSYTGQRIYAPNTKEKPVKRAILKGQTLVNKLESGFGTNPIGISTATKAKYTLLTKLEVEKDYTISFDLEDVTGSDPLNVGFGWGWAESITVSNGRHTIKFPKERITTDQTFVAFYFYSNTTTSANVKNVVVVEGSFEDIPYFEGMQSVKLPVLTTCGKNLFDFEKTQSGYLGDNPHALYAPDQSNRTSDYIRVKPNTTYTYSFNGFTASQVGSEYWTGWYYYTSPTEVSKKNMKRQVSRGSSDTFKTVTFTTPSDCYYVRIGSRGLALDGATVQLEEGSTATEYEPYKTNILTVNEDVTLRSNGDICDELNLLTGQLTKRIDEDGVVLSQEVVKTVDLTIHDKDHQKVERLTSFEGGTHFTTSSQDGSLLPTLTVDVVTNLEETLKVCSLEGNTM